MFIRPARTAAFAAACLLFPGLAPAATLLGEAAYLSPGDLTVVEIGGTAMEFLDLTLTQGIGVAASLAAHGGAGFTLADAAQVAELMDAFGFAYAQSPGAVQEIFPTSVQAAAFIDALGNTTPTPGTNYYALGAFADPAGIDGAHSYFCVSQGDCGPTSFVYDRDYEPVGWAGNVGVVLVREASAAADVPLPAAAPLMLLGLGALGLLRRKG
ncbi:VPLPA-CTERM sorting domain-containing protein [Rhodovulum sp. DZ06]|uniref:VPLPA-CTERM sorting domain-containing protein n=1 Tax=Rhodovulum sp. DZ06 TaxID=3425126 RepID=UPI003D34C4AF